MKKDKVLIVDDEDDIVITWTMRLEQLGFEVYTAGDGKEGLAKMINYLPDLVLLDISMPRMNGIELCKLIKQDIITSQIPIILLTASGELNDKLHGIESGADDYITKDADPKEIEARIKMVLRRYKENIGANPLTKLPGNNSIELQISERISKNEEFAVAYADLDNFKAYNDNYGFKKGDEIILLAAQILFDTQKQIDKFKGFVGHIGGDDFVIIGGIDTIADICMKIIERLDTEIPRFYNPKDRDCGYITTTNRQGKIEEFPLVSISIAVVTNKNRKLSSISQISQIASDLKKYLKTLEGSNFIIDKRRRK